MKIWLSLFSLCFLFNCSSASAHINKVIQTACSSAKTLGYKGKTLYEQKQYLKALDYFKRQATWSTYCLDHQERLPGHLSPDTTALAMKNVALSYLHLNQPAWARAWLLPFAGTPYSDPYLKKLPEPKQPKSLVGYYVQYQGEGNWNYMQVIREKNHYQLQYKQHQFHPVENRFTTVKYFSLTMPVAQQQASFQTGSCTIQFNFEFNSQWGQHIVAKQNSGETLCVYKEHNLWIDGHYIKTESRP